MDIRKWLNEIVQSDPPSKLARRPLEHPLSLPNPLEPVLSRRSKPDHSNSDSSCLDTLPQNKDKLITSQKNHNSKLKEQRTEDSASQDTHRESNKTPASSQRYARKPRRKTRLERYDPSSKATQERKKDARPKRHSEAKKPPCKSKRKKPDSGVVQAFRAENVSGDRLTLKPREQLGIFNKGKTSTAARGRGLPDLVFSEMKFLQKQPDEPEPELNLRGGCARKKRKKDHNYSKDEEISAFFTSRHSALVNENVHPTPTSAQHNTLPKASRREKKQSPHARVAIPTIEMPDNPKLSSIKSKNLHGSTSCISWSESPIAPSSQPVCFGMTSCAHTVQLSGKDMPSVDERDTPSKRPATLPLRTQEATDTVERLKISSTAPSHQRVSRSHSCPQKSSSPQRPNMRNKTINRNGRTFRSPASMPPYISVSQSSFDNQVQIISDHSRSGAFSLLGINHQSHHRQSVFTEGRCADVHLPNSSDLEKAIQQCENALKETCRSMLPEENGLRINPARSSESKKPRGPMRCVLQIPGVPRLRSAEKVAYVPLVPNLAGPGIYEQQAQRRQLPARENFRDRYSHRLEYMNCVDGLDYIDSNWDESLEDLGPDVAEEDSKTGDVEDDYLGEHTPAPPGFWRPNRLY